MAPSLKAQPDLPRDAKRRPRRRGAVAAASLLALVVGGGLSVLGAHLTADFVEDRSARDVREALRAGDFFWVEVSSDGLQVQLGGIAPDEVQRFRARARAGTVVDDRRVVDEMRIDTTARLDTPDFKVELLRNDDEISIVGLVPGALDRGATVANLRRSTGANSIADLVETANYPAPTGWNDAFGYGLRAAQLASRAKISISAGRVEVRAITASAADKVTLENALRRDLPRDVELVADITAPRPLIAPFTLRFVHDANGAHFDACAADTDAARARILAAGSRAGVADGQECTLGLGAPSARWGEVSEAAINAVAFMGAGAVTISDTEVGLFAPVNIATTRFDEAVGRLQAQLPPSFTLETEHERPEQADAQNGPVEFSASSDLAGVSLRGRITDGRMREAVESFARARFGHIDTALREDQTLPSGWTVRAVAALEALDDLDNGSVTVTPDVIRLTGVSGSARASDVAATRLSQRLGAGARYELAIRYDRRLDPLLGLPSGAECVDQLNAAMQESEIGFEPSSAIIAGDPEPTLDRIGQIMQNCAEFRIEVGGHTDSQGSEGFNARLSQQRAQAVLEAMNEKGIDTSLATARGYGPTRPIADNDTEAGREANRRIEFTLQDDAPVTTEETAEPELVTGVTDSAEAVAARTQAAVEAAAQEAAMRTLIPESAAQIAVDKDAGDDALSNVVTAATGALPAVSLHLLDALTMPLVSAIFPAETPMGGEDAGTGEASGHDADYGLDDAHSVPEQLQEFTLPQGMPALTLPASDSAETDARPEPRPQE